MGSLDTEASFVVWFSSVFLSVRNQVLSASAGPAGDKGRAVTCIPGEAVALCDEQLHCHVFDNDLVECR